MADYILDVVNQTAKMDWAYTFQRTDAFPLDRTTLFSSYDDAVLYAQGGADERGLSGTSYVGQSISVYDAEKSSVTLYIIEVDRSLKEVGSAPVGDNLSIEVVNGVVQLKNFGKGYYKYIPAVKDEITNEITTPSNYEFVENDFVAGLEPRVVLNTNGDLEIAWYEPSEETIDGVNAKVESVTNTVDTLEEIVSAEGGLIDQVDNLLLQIGTSTDDAGNKATGLYAEIERVDQTLSLKANAVDVYTKEATNNAISVAIGEAIAEVDHLKREVVNILPDASDADANTIYMVPSGLLEDDNKYYEWILIDGIFEQVGSWEVDLSKYATKDALTTVDIKVNTLTQTVVDNQNKNNETVADLQNQIDAEVLRAKAAEQNNVTALENKADKGTTLADYGITDVYTKNEIYTKGETDQAIIDKISEVNGGESAGEVLGQLNSYKKIVNMEVWGDETGSGVEGNSRIDILHSKVNSLIGAEPNFISSVDTNELNVDDTGKLSIITLPASKVTDLTALLNTKADKANVEAIDLRVTNIEDILVWKDM